VAVVAGVLLLVVLGWVVVRLHDKGQLTAANWTPFPTAEIWPSTSFPVSAERCYAAGISVALASVLGLILGLGRLSDNAAVRALSGVVTEFFRAVPVLMMMLFAYALYSQYGLFPSEQLAPAFIVVAALFILVNYSVSLARKVEHRMRSRGRTAGRVAAAGGILVGGTAAVAEAEAIPVSNRSAT